MFKSEPLDEYTDVAVPELRRDSTTSNGVSTTRSSSSESLDGSEKVSEWSDMGLRGVLERDSAWGTK